MFNGSNCGEKSQLSGIMTEPLKSKCDVIGLRGLPTNIETASKKLFFPFSWKKEVKDIRFSVFIE